MKQSNTNKASFTHNDIMYEYWQIGRYEMASDSYENIDIDTVKAREIFAKSVIDFLNSEFKTNLKYDGSYMPKFYNYEDDKINLRNVTVMRYILPLREGGSLPALAEADDDFKYVLKFRGAGHGVKMLISELLGGKITEILGLKIPELVFANLDVDFGRTESDEEIQDLLKFSEGLNLGLHLFEQLS